MMTPWTLSRYCEINLTKDLFFRDRLSITFEGRWATCEQTSESLRQTSVDEYVLDYNEQSAQGLDAASGIGGPVAALNTLWCGLCEDVETTLEKFSY